MEKWMQTMPERVKKQPIIHLAIPGTHNSMTYTIQKDADISPDNNKAVEYISGLSNFVIGDRGQYLTMPNFCKTQRLSVLEQLNNGIRYLDFRVGAKPNDLHIYFCHGLWGAEVLFYLQMITVWLDKHKEEVVILDFQHFYDFTLEHHTRLINGYIKKVFGSRLCPFLTAQDTRKIQDYTLEWMEGTDQRVIVIYRDKDIEDRKIDVLWPGWSWITPRPDTSDKDQLEPFLSERLKTERPSVLGYVSQCVLTPCGTSIPTSFWKSFQERYSGPAYDAVRSWLLKQRPGPTGINVVVADCVENFGEFQNLIVSLNAYFKYEYIYNRIIADI